MVPGLVERVPDKDPVLVLELAYEGLAFIGVAGLISVSPICRT